MRYDLDPAHVRRAMASYVNRLGDACPPEFAALVLDIADRRTPYVAITVTDAGETDDAEFVTYAAAARRLGVSRRTISRRVAEQQLVVVGRRIAVASLTALAAAPCGTDLLQPGAGPRS